QDEITTAVVMALRQSILGESELSGGYKGNYDAYNAYLLGQDHFKNKNLAAYKLAIEQYKKAIEIDPTMALAWAGLSEAYSEQTGFGSDFKTGYARAREAAFKAIELDAKLPEAYLALANVQRSNDWDWDATEVSLLRAFALRPGDTDIIQELASLKYLKGNYSEALNDIEEALSQDPLNEELRIGHANILLQFNRYEEAITFFKAYAKKYPNRGVSHFYLAEAYYGVGDIKQALTYAKKEEFKFLRLMHEAIFYEKLDNKPLAEEKLNELIETYGDDVSTQVASVYAAWGEADQAFAALERGYKVRDPGLTYIQSNIDFKPYHDDPRYAAFLKKMGFK
ncbi:MAG: tetratricopeptide repeat protein, partial [Proteobacteria bacterium]|nr:tetratricopeptide repeat protein [Pseudomonadota bacterium]